MQACGTLLHDDLCVPTRLPTQQWQMRSASQPFRNLSRVHAPRARLQTVPPPPPIDNATPERTCCNVHMDEHRRTHCMRSWATSCRRLPTWRHPHQAPRPPSSCCSVSLPCCCPAAGQSPWPMRWWVVASRRPLVRRAGGRGSTWLRCARPPLGPVHVGTSPGVHVHSAFRAVARGAEWSV